MGFGKEFGLAGFFLADCTLNIQWGRGNQHILSISSVLRIKAATFSGGMLFVFLLYKVQGYQELAYMCIPLICRFLISGIFG